MMSSMPHIFLFTSTLLLGTLVSMSSNNWLLIWMGLELNLMSFIPLMIASSLKKETQSAVKYFLAQACASATMIIMMSIHMLPKETVFSQNFITTMLMYSLLTKLGTVPCHWWFPLVMSNISWPMGLILMTWQKIAPMFIILTFIDSLDTMLLYIMVSTGALVGGIGGLNQTSLRPLLAFSSIGHMSWTLAASMISYTASMVYLMTYILISTSLLLFLMINNVSSSFKMLLLWKKHNPYKAMALCTLLMSMGGLPPFLGFMPKLWVISELIKQSTLIMLPFLLVGTVMNLTYYFNIMFNMILFSKNAMKTSTWVNILNIMTLMIATSPILIYSYLMVQ